MFGLSAQGCANAFAGLSLDSALKGTLILTFSHGEKEPFVRSCGAGVGRDSVEPTECKVDRALRRSMAK